MSRSQKLEQGGFNEGIEKRPGESDRKLAVLSPREGAVGLPAPSSVTQGSLTAQDAAQREKVPSARVSRTCQGCKKMAKEIPDIKARKS